MTVCSIDLRVGGNYHYVMVTKDGIECSFRGTFLEIEAPNRTVETWRFDGWPDTEAVETMALHEMNGVTKLTYSLKFRDMAGRAHMDKFDGLVSSIDNVDAYLRSLLDPAARFPVSRRSREASRPVHGRGPSGDRRRRHPVAPAARSRRASGA